MQVQMHSEIGTQYTSASQRARVITELWGESNLYCVHCDSASLARSRPNAEAIDFSCAHCGSPFQLKSQASALSARIVDAGYEAMRRAISEGRTPNLIVAHYDLGTWQMRNVLLVPRFAFSMSAIEKRKPLALTARRAGWVGCNILLCNIPEDARIDLLKDGTPASPDLVRRKYSRLLALGSEKSEVRGWMLDVLRIARSLKKEYFSLGELYAHVAELQSLHPQNRHVRPKIRQQMQRLRDLGLVEFGAPGQYRIRSPEVTV